MLHKIEPGPLFPAPQHRGTFEKVCIPTLNKKQDFK